MAKKMTKTEIERSKTDFDPPIGRAKPQRVGRIEAKLQADKEAAAKEKKKPPVVVEMTKAKETKNQQISVKMYPDAYQKFCKINRALGLSNNSSVNQLIARFIRENENLLNE